MSDEQLDPWEKAQRAIDDALREFLETAPLEHDQERQPIFLTDWVVVTSGHREGPDGNSSSVYNRVVRDDQPPHVTLGLLTYERASYEHFLMSGQGYA